MIALLLVFAVTRASDAYTLRSPWDATSSEASSSDEPAGERCASSPDLPTDLFVAGYYGDSARSEIDETRKDAYDKATSAFRNAARELESMADRYQRTHDRAAAKCAVEWLRDFANRGTLLNTRSTNQAAYFQGWMLGALAVAALKIRSADPGGLSGPVSAWFARLAEQQVTYYRGRSGNIDGKNNHLYWAGFAVMAAGIVADRVDLFHWGTDGFHAGVGQIAPNGTLPLELARRSRALHYHLFAAAPLVMIAELAISNGCDLYSGSGERLSALIQIAIQGAEDPALFEQLAGIRQEAVNENELVWARPFAQRFDKKSLLRIVAQHASESSLYIGGLPPRVSPQPSVAKCPLRDEAAHH